MVVPKGCTVDMYKVGDVYFLSGGVNYYSVRYKKSLTLPDGFPSNGANVVRDKCPLGFFVHDFGCVYGVWDNGTPMTNLQLSFVYHDILKANGFYVRAKIRFLGTLAGGGGAARKNGMFKLKGYHG